MKCYRRVVYELHKPTRKCNGLIKLTKELTEEDLKNLYVFDSEKELISVLQIEFQNDPEQECIKIATTLTTGE